MLGYLSKSIIIINPELKEAQSVWRRLRKDYPAIDTTPKNLYNL